MAGILAFDGGMASGFFPKAGPDGSLGLILRWRGLVMVYPFLVVIAAILVEI